MAEKLPEGFRRVVQIRRMKLIWRIIVVQSSGILFCLLKSVPRDSKLRPHLEFYAKIWQLLARREA